MTNTKTKLLLFLTLFLLSWTLKPEGNLSTGSALMKYSDILKNKKFLLFPELREAPVKWFDSIPELKLIGSKHLSDFEMNGKTGEFFLFQVLQRSI